MSGMNVHSDILKGGTKLEKTSASKGKDAPVSPENVASVFAEMFSGFIKANVDPKGQNSKEDQELEEKQSVGNPMQSLQNLNGLGSMLGYGNFTLSNLFQPMLQSDLPAGKEANSGNAVSQGAGGLANANSSLSNAPIAVSNFGLGLLNFASLVSDEVFTSTGMTTPKPQGSNPENPELDKYRQVITNLLVALSGEITESSPKENPLNLEAAAARTMDFHMMKIVQGWMTVTDENAKVGRQASSGQKEIQVLLDALVTGVSTDNPALDAKTVTLLADLKSFLRQGTEVAKAPPQMIEGEGYILASEAKGSSESFIKVLKGNEFDIAVTQGKETALLVNVQPKPDGTQLTETEHLKIKGTFREEVQKGDNKQPTELSGIEGGQNLKTSVGIGVASNTFATNVADGKSITVPVWEQVSTVFREQVTNRHQQLKELDIQLHPADLGKIQIVMRWENGQVHLQVQASEAATGQLLQNQLSELRQTLTSNGVNCGMLQMGQSGERQQNPQGDASQRTFKQNSDLNDDEELIAALPLFSLGQDKINRINVTA